MKNWLNPSGQIAIGNFCANNPSKEYMHLLDWKLNHRSPNTLKTIAEKAGFGGSETKIKREATGVNLFLHLEAR